MATSGSVDYSRNRNQIIDDAYRHMNVYGAGQTVSNEDYSFAATVLNGIVKSWAAQGHHLFAREQGVLFLADNTGKYLLSSASGSARACKADDAVITELGGDEATAQTALTVDSSSGMAASDIVGVELDAGTIHWSTISSVDSATQITIADALPSAAATNNKVFTFTSRLNRPLRIHSVRLLSGTATDPHETILHHYSNQEYYNLARKSTNGTPSGWFYDRQHTTGELYLWPRPSDPSSWLQFTYERQLEDFDAATDDADFPQEWIEALTFNLALKLMPAFGKDADAISTMAAFAADALNNALSFDTETASTYFTTNRV